MFLIFTFAYKFIIVQNFKEMQSNLDDIIARIRIKLNNFTEEDNSMSYGIANQPKIDTKVRSSFQKQKQQAYKHQPALRYNKNKQQNPISKITKNFRKISQQKSQEMLKASRSCQMIQINKNKNQLKKDPALIHTQTYLSLRKRNKALEDDVKNLKERLKVIQQSVDKSKNSININKQKQLLLKSKNQGMKKSGRTKVSTFEQKNIKKQPFPKNYKFLFHKNSYNSQTKGQMNKLKTGLQKNNQTSLHYITFNDKMKFDLSPSGYKKSNSKTLPRYKSSETLQPTNPSSQQAIKQGKQNAEKLKHNGSIADSTVSNASYLRPIQKEKKNNGNISVNLNKRINLNDKLKKGYKNKLK